MAFFVDAMDLDQTQAIYDLTEEEEEQVESERDVKKEVNIFEESWEGGICNLLIVAQLQSSLILLWNVNECERIWNKTSKVSVV